MYFTIVVDYGVTVFQFSSNQYNTVLSQLEVQYIYPNINNYGMVVQKLC